MAPRHADTPWYRHPAATAAADAALLTRIAALCQDLPAHLAEIADLLDGVQAFQEYDAAANAAGEPIWAAREELANHPNPAVRLELLDFAASHLPPAARAVVLRRLAKDPSLRVRRRADAVIPRARLREVALPLGTTPDPFTGLEPAWDATGWLHGAFPGPLNRHAQGARVLARFGLPELANVGALRELCNVRSVKQLAWLLTATDQPGPTGTPGPYTRFTIPKRDGTPRVICAPGGQLRWVQQRILRAILDKVPPHDAAHGFRAGRSTVTNARPHLGAALLLKFDLKDFFPTIHYYRVVGLFTRLGYRVGDARFRPRDDATHVAPVLARLCCYAADPHVWGGAFAPQGAPTSPAISNLVCRRLDARLSGLAKHCNGVYTRYADDLTFSFQADGLQVGKFRWWVDQVCHQEGFIVHQDKFRVIRGTQRQLVTGLVVNDELRVPRQARRAFRAMLHNCRRNGVAAEAQKFQAEHGRHGRFADYLRGFASYVNMVHPEEGQELLAAVAELVGPEPQAGEGQP